LKNRKKKGDSVQMQLQIIAAILKNNESLAWHRFLQRTWRELEELYWEQTYAA